MEVIYGLLPLIAILGLAMVGILFWAIRSGQYDDMEGPGWRVIMDDDDPLLPNRRKETSASDTPQPVDDLAAPKKPTS
ncbi:MAG: cbb3-type cytochrome oxidase assembly protein CcoS [Nitrospinae bacterium]|nr:cbb3-type cytochrome oxidase assembly protein CcoS [Nitrospinota bacterium]MBF0633907.1 cbb3-type cytochrome oxidase assembly protein CcoS [Nitrospinota bacterium]